MESCFGSRSAQVELDRTGWEGPELGNRAPHWEGAEKQAGWGAGAEMRPIDRTKHSLQ